MSPDAIFALAAELLALHATAHDGRNLTGWKIVGDTAVARAGICRYDSRKIGLSIKVLPLWPEAEVRDTILHEIAHALAGPGAKHGPDWKRWCLIVGARPSHSATRGLPQPELPWVGRCPAGHESSKSRKPKNRSSCSTCCPRWNVAHEIVWSLRNPPRVPGESIAATAARAIRPAPAPPRQVPPSRQDSLFRRLSPVDTAPRVP